MATITRKEHKRLLLVGAAMPTILVNSSKRITEPKKSKKSIAIPIHVVMDPSAPMMTSFGAKCRVKKGVRNNLYNKI